MALPKTSHTTESIVAYTMEVIGRLRGVASTDVLIPDPVKRQIFTDTALAIETPTLALYALFSANQQNNLMTHRSLMGQGRGIDYVFGRHVAQTAETIRTGPALGSREHTEFRKVFKDGNTQAFTDPTIREDKDLCEDLGRRIQLVEDFPAKAGLLAANGMLFAVIEPAASAIIDIEKQQSKDFTREVEGRQAVIDALWTGKKTTELAVGRDRGLVSFIFFDFRKGSSESSSKPEDGGNPQGGEEKPPT